MDNIKLTEATGLMDLFSTAAENAKSHANNLLKSISEGYVPESNVVQALNMDIKQMQGHYSELLQVAKSSLSDDELPDEQTASNLFNAISEKQRRAFEKRILSACLTLQKFLSVKSYIETYSLALEPFQKKAELLIKEIDAGSYNSIEETTVFEDSAVFLRALEIEDLESEEGLQLLDSLNERFPVKVQIGLARKQYYLDENSRYEKEEKLESDSIVINDLVQSDETLISSDTEEKADSDNLSHNEAGKDSADLPDVTIIENESTDNENQSDDKVDSQVFDEGSLSELFTATNHIKRSTPSASAFKKDIPKYPRETFALLPMLTNLGALSENQIFRFGIVMNCFTEDDVAFESLKRCLASLCTKSMLARFEMDGVPVYCLTGYSAGCLKKESIQQLKIFEISFGQNYIVSDGTIEKSRLEHMVHYNEKLLLYFEGTKELLSKKDHAAVKSSISLIDGIYRVIVIDDAQKYLCSLYCKDIEDYETENLLVINDEIPEGFKEKYNRVFELSNGSIKCIGSSNEPIESAIEVNGKDESDSVEDTPVEDKNTLSYEEEREGVADPENASQESQRQDTVSVAETVNDQNDLGLDMAVSDPSDSLSESLIDALLDRSKTPTDTEFVELIHNICNGKDHSNGIMSNVMRATLLAKAAALSVEKGNTSLLARELLLATCLPFATIHYSSETISEVLAACSNECLSAAIYLQSLLLPSSAYDYVLYQMSESTFRNFDVKYPSLAPIKALFNKMTSVHAVLPMGFSASVMALLGDATERRKYTEELQIRARNLMTLPNIKTRIKALPVMYGNCFGNGSELYDCMKIIAENKTDECDWVKEVLAQYCDAHDDELTISEDKTEARLDAEWDEANPKNHFILEFDARPQALRQFYNRLDLMKTWVEHVNQSYSGKLDMKRINVLKKEIIELAETAKEGLLEKNEDLDYLPVLVYALNHIICYLSDPSTVHGEMKEFLYTGVFSVDEKGMPILDDTMANIKYYEQWRNVLKHIVSPITNAVLAREKIIDEVGSELFDNLNQLMRIGDSEHDFRGILTEAQIKDAKIAAEDRTKRFKENLELAYTYNRISEPEKERFATIMEQYEPTFFDIMDFGCWGQFLSSLEREIYELASEKQKALRRELNARKQSLKEGETSIILEEAEMLLEKERNFAVTEEYFNRFDNGERQFSDDLYALLHEEDSFADFLSDKKFKPLQQECERHSGKTLKSFAWSFLEPRVPREWTVRQREDSRRLVDNWPLRKDATQTSSIQNIFTCLGFSVKNVVKGNGKKEEFFKVDVEPTAKSMADYRHPISIFGTQTRSPLNVVVLYGNYAPKQLVDTITALDFGGMTIVLIDRPLDRATRRSIAEIFHTQTSGQNPFLVIDQILILYLAMHQVTERLPVLLKCTLPYSTYQPFVRDGGSTTDEMFCGRSRELATIIDPNGASVVYGGRQLGKTALLQRAESRCYKPDNKEYAVYSNIINASDECVLVEKITEDINRKTNLNLSQTKDLSSFCKEIDKLFRNGKVKSLLLLLDEADTFLASIADTKYRELQPLIDLKRETTNKFKFVLAGLHNVCRAKNATSENGVFGQLGTPLCVKPLSPTDALQLLSRPLKYLGFEIDRYPHLETILTNTNYYPGILQFFGYNLVEAFATQYGRYYRAVNGNPPFTLQDEQLGAVMNDADLNRSIRDKFRWSLELDQRYFMLARCVTLLYYLRDENTENWLGFSVEDIMEIADEYQIHCLESCGTVEYINLLDEMVEMGILSKPANGLYKLRRNSFVNIIGDDFDTLDADIVNNNKETA